MQIDLFFWGGGGRDGARVKGGKGEGWGGEAKKLRGKFKSLQLKMFMCYSYINSLAL